MVKSYRVVLVGCLLFFLTRSNFYCTCQLHLLLRIGFRYVLLLGHTCSWDRRIFLFLAQLKYLRSRKFLLVELSSSINPSFFCNDFNLFFLCFQIILFNRALQG